MTSPENVWRNGEKSIGLDNYGMSESPIYTNLINAVTTDLELILECKLAVGDKPATVATLIMPHEVAGKLGLVISKLLKGEDDERTHDDEPPLAPEKPEREHTGRDPQ